MYRKSIYIQKKGQWCWNGQNTYVETEYMSNIEIWKNREIQGRAVARPVCQDLPNFCRLRYPFRCSAYYVPLNSFSLLESIWLR